MKKFKIGNLYHRYIKGNVLERLGFTSESLALELEKKGYIKVTGSFYEEVVPNLGWPNIYDILGLADSFDGLIRRMK